LCRLGPEAEAAVPDILALHDSWLNRYFTRDSQWQFTLARIGVPLNKIPKPKSLVHDTQDDFEARLRRKLGKFNVSRDCRGSWS
jgi:hypothetical protein